MPSTGCLLRMIKHRVGGLINRQFLFAGKTMLFTDTTFIGIDIPGARRPLTYAAIDAELNLIALASGDDENVLAFVNGQDRAFVAINNPRSTNKGYMAEESFRSVLNPRPRPGRWDRWRVAEYALRQSRIKVRRTPKSPENAPVWMQKGFKLYRALANSGYRPYVQDFVPEDEHANGDVRFSIECYPHAAFTALLEHIPFNKSTLEGRIQRQLILYVNEVDVPNPMRIFEEITRYRLLKGELLLDDLFEPTQLDALVAAYTARMASLGKVTLLGHPLEGQIVIPVRQMLAKYT